MQLLEKLEKEDIQDDWYSPLDWGSVEDLVLSMIMRNTRDQLRTTQKDLVNKLKRAGTAVSKVTLVSHYAFMVLKH